MLFSFKIDATITEEQSTNKFYAGMHWKKRAEIADYWHEFVYYTLREYRIRQTPVEECVDIVVKTNDGLDSDNHFIVIKMIIDAMVEYGILEDDNRANINSTKHEFYDEEGIKVEVHDANCNS